MRVPRPLAKPARSKQTPISTTRLVDDRPPETLDPEHREMIRKGLDDVRRGDFATDAEIEAIFARFRR